MSNCPSCGSPITDDSRFCSHCGAKLPESTQKLEIKIEDTAKLEEVRLKYRMEEANRSVSKADKIKRWVGWILCVAFLCLAIITRDPNNQNLSVVFFILFMASGIFAIVVTFTSAIRKIFRRKKQ